MIIPHLKQFRSVISSVRRSLTHAQRSAFENQLASMLDDEDELVAAKITPSISSLDGLLRYAAANQSFLHPNLSLDNEGKFVASWCPHDQAKISLTFDSSSSGTWVAAERSPSSRKRASGAFSVTGSQPLPPEFLAWMSA